MKLREVIEYVEGCDQKSCTSITLYDPHSWRGDYSQLEFDYKLKPSTVKEMLKALRSPIGVEYWGWKGGDYRMDSNCDVHIGTYGMGGEPLTKLLLQHIIGSVCVQDSISSVISPYQAGDRKKLEEIHKLLLDSKGVLRSAAEDTHIAQIWELAIAMDTRVGFHSPEGFLEDLRKGGAKGDLMDAQSYYEDLCARLGEVAYPYTYKPAYDS